MSLKGFSTSGGALLRSSGGLVDGNALCCCPCAEFQRCDDSSIKLRGLAEYYMLFMTPGLNGIRYGDICFVFNGFYPCTGTEGFLPLPDATIISCDACSCCLLVNCDDENDFIVVYCNDINTATSEEDTFLVGTTCYFIEGFYVDCEGVVEDFTYDDVFESCEECGCVCIEVVPCDTSEGDDPLYFKVCAVDDLPEIGKVIKIGDDCYVYGGTTPCEEGEEEVSPGATSYDTCEECGCKCAVLENCTNASDEITVKFCDAAGLELGIGDVIFHNGKCYEIDSFTECEDGEPEISGAEEEPSCATCRTDCTKCVEDECLCSGSKNFGVTVQGPNCNFGNPQTANILCQWTWGAFGGNRRFTASANIAGSWAFGVDNFPLTTCDIGNGTDTTISNVGFSFPCGTTGSQCVIAPSGNGYTFTITGLSDTGGSGDCGCAAFNGVYFVPCTLAP